MHRIQIISMLWLMLVALVILGLCLKGCVEAAIRHPKDFLIVLGCVLASFVTLLAAVMVMQ